MTKIELDLLSELRCAKLDRRCDDYLIPNTDKHWAILEEALAWNCNKTVEQFRTDESCANEREYFQRGVGETIFASAHLLLSYLNDKAMKELRANAE